MSQYGREGLNVHAALYRQRGEGMAQVMEAHMLTACQFQNLGELPLRHAGRERHIVFHRGWEHPAGEYRFLVLPQHLQNGGRQNDLADGCFRLRLAELQFALHGADLLIHIQHTRLKVQIVPLERHQLTPAQAGGQLQKEKFVVTLGLCLDEKTLKLFPVQHLHLPRPFGRQLTANGRVGADEPILHRFLQCRAAGGMAHTHHPVRQALAVAFGKCLPTILFEPCVELLQVILCQFMKIHLVRDSERLVWNFAKSETEMWKEPPEPLLEKIADTLFSESDRWEGTASELCERLAVDIKPNVLSLRLSINASRLFRDYGIRYQNSRTHDGRKVSLWKETEQTA